VQQFEARILANFAAEKSALEELTNYLGASCVLPTTSLEYDGMTKSQ